MPAVVFAAGWGLVAGLALVAGALIARFLPVSNRVVGLIMGFGTGVLISAVTFELAQDAFETSGAWPMTLGLTGGALVYFAGDWWLDRRGGHRRKSPNGPAAGAAGMALVLGSLLDGIPEAAAIGVSMIGSGSVGVAVIVAVALSNLPEGISATSGLISAGRSDRFIFGLWGALALACATSAALGYVVLGALDPSAVSITQAFAAGAILTMLVDTMVPEAVEHAGQWVGLVTVAGFLLSMLISFSG